MSYEYERLLRSLSSAAKASDAVISPVWDRMGVGRRLAVARSSEVPEAREYDMQVGGIFVLFEDIGLNNGGGFLRDIAGFTNWYCSDRGLGEASSNRFPYISEADLVWKICQEVVAPAMGVEEEDIRYTGNAASEMPLSYDGPSSRELAGGQMWELDPFAEVFVGHEKLITLADQLFPVRESGWIDIFTSVYLRFPDYAKNWRRAGIAAADAMWPSLSRETESVRSLFTQNLVDESAGHVRSFAGALELTALELA